MLNAILSVRESLKYREEEKHMCEFPEGKH